MEIWKDIKGYEGKYRVSSFGNVSSLNYRRSGKEKVMEGGFDSDGYKLVTLRIHGTKKTHPIHRLVAESFLNHIRCGSEKVVNHKDWDIKNNHVDNLEIVTGRYNTGYRKDLGLSNYLGVDFHKGKWRARISLNEKSKHLGYFNNEIEASNAYQKALKELK